MNFYSSVINIIRAFGLRLLLSRSSIFLILFPATATASCMPQQPGRSSQSSSPLLSSCVSAQASRVRKRINTRPRGAANLVRLASEDDHRLLRHQQQRNTRREPPRGVAAPSACQLPPTVVGRHIFVLSSLHGHNPADDSFPPPAGTPDKSTSISRADDDGIHPRLSSFCVCAAFCRGCPVSKGAPVRSGRPKEKPLVFMRREYCTLFRTLARQPRNLAANVGLRPAFLGGEDTALESCGTRL